MLKIIKEISDWNTEFRPPNHTYLINKKGQILAYAKWHGNDIDILKSKPYIDKRYRKFIEDNHSGLSKLIPLFKENNNQDNIIPDNTRIFKVKSKDNTYTVLLKDNNYSCDCIGFGYRGKCKHIDAVAKKQQIEKKLVQPLDNSAEI